MHKERGIYVKIKLKKNLLSKNKIKKAFIE
jgi:hypothetical protein